MAAECHVATCFNAADMVAAKAAQQKRKATDKAGGDAKKGKFKF
jgi:hypothetical protein